MQRGRRADGSGATRLEPRAYTWPTALFQPLARNALTQDAFSQLPSARSAPKVRARMITPEQVRAQLSTVKYPGFTRDIVSFGLIKDIRVTGIDVTVQMSLTTNDAKIPQAIKEGSEEALRAIEGIGNVSVRIDIQAPAQAAGAGGSGGAVAEPYRSTALQRSRRLVDPSSSQEYL